ncbi:MAG: EscU/YscU/HrcU family type III secretion system export apparatus switch protein [Tepidisphaeraceae bacterium]
MSDAGDKPHPPSRRRLAELRRRGEVATSRDLTAAAVLAAAVLLFGLGVDDLAGVIGRHAAAVFSAAATGNTDTSIAFVTAVLRPMAWLLAALFAAAMAGGYLQVGPLAAFGRLKPRADRLNAATNLAGQFSPGKIAVELLKTAAKVLAVAAIAFLVVRSNLNFVLASPTAELPFLIAGLRAIVLALLQVCVVAFVVFGAIDFIVQRQRFFARHRMSARELKREAKDDTGDPLVRSAQRRSQDDVSLARTLDAVRGATVLILGDSAAAAVRYAPPADDAPRVVASGRAELGRRILAAADSAGIPVRRDAALALALANSPPEAAVTPDLYAAVAAALFEANRSKTAPQST